MALVVIAYQTAGWMKYNASLLTASSEIEANFLKQSQLFGPRDIIILRNNHSGHMIQAPLRTQLGAYSFVVWDEERAQSEIDRLTKQAKKQNLTVWVEKTLSSGKLQKADTVRLVDRGWYDVTLVKM